MREDARKIIGQALVEVMPDKAVAKALKGIMPGRDVTVVAVGKAGWTMAKAAKEILGGRIRKGLVITKYGHSRGALEGFEVVEAGHPIPDENSVTGVEKALELVADLGVGDEIVFLLSGGGSSLFEKPVEGLELKDLQDVTEALLRSGAGITEINVIRKRLSAVKGGKFALACNPAHVLAIVLSDVVGDRLDMIASGPLCEDTSTREDVLRIIEKYKLIFPEKIRAALEVESVHNINNVDSVVTGSVADLCRAAAKSAEELGYHPLILSTTLECEAREAGRFMASIARQIKTGGEGAVLRPPCAVIVGGETVVKVEGNGLGGRNQEIALSAAPGIAGLEDTLIFSLGSDGTDGPTDAAGGMVMGKTTRKLIDLGIDSEEVLRNNDSYHALAKVGGLIITGATGTNVNDITVILCR